MTAHFHVLIVDDEQPARRRIRALLESDEDVGVIVECDGAECAVPALTRGDVDIAFLDVQMPGLDGFDIIARVGLANLPVLVFVTAHDEHALRAFEVHAIDYVLKPVQRGRFYAALERAKAQVLAWQGPAPPPDVETPGTLTRILVRVKGRHRVVRTDDVDWIEAHDNDVVLHVGKDALTVRTTMARLERRLSSDVFVRIHRSTMVNVARVSELEPWFHGDYVVVLTTGARLRTSRRFRANLLERFRIVP